jgi:predicted molibdopterin-dependent oxidoreductase YjgC
VNENLYELLDTGKTKNLFIFGEDPIGCAINKSEMINLINKSSFKVVLDYFITETATVADLILPASFPFETGGSYSNTQKYVIPFEMQYETKLTKKTYQQLIDLMNKFGIKNRVDLTNNISIEISSLLFNNPGKRESIKLNHSNEEKDNKLFNYGCDYLNKKFEESFLDSFKN